MALTMSFRLFRETTCISRYSGRQVIWTNWSPTPLSAWLWSVRHETNSRSIIYRVIYLDNYQYHHLQSRLFSSELTSNYQYPSCCWYYDFEMIPPAKHFYLIRHASGIPRLWIHGSRAITMEGWGYGWETQSILKACAAGSGSLSEYPTSSWIPVSPIRDYGMRGVTSRRKNHLVKHPPFLVLCKK